MFNNSHDVPDVIYRSALDWTLKPRISSRQRTDARFGVTAQFHPKTPEPSLTFDLSFLSTADAVVTLRHDGGGPDTEWTDRGQARPGTADRDTGGGPHRHKAGSVPAGWPGHAQTRTEPAELSSSRQQWEQRSRREG